PWNDSTTRSANSAATSSTTMSSPFTGTASPCLPQLEGAVKGLAVDVVAAHAGERAGEGQCRPLLAHAQRLADRRAVVDLNRRLDHPGVPRPLDGEDAGAVAVDGSDSDRDVVGGRQRDPGGWQAEPAEHPAAQQM